MPRHINFAYQMKKIILEITRKKKAQKYWWKHAFIIKVDYLLHETWYLGTLKNPKTQQTSIQTAFQKPLKPSTLHYLFNDSFSKLVLPMTPYINYFSYTRTAQ